MKAIEDETANEGYVRPQCSFKWKQWPDKRCPALSIGDEHGREEYCAEHLRIMENRAWRAGAKKSVSEAQKWHYRKFWAGQNRR